MGLISSIRSDKKLQQTKCELRYNRQQLEGRMSWSWITWTLELTLILSGYEKMCFYESQRIADELTLQYQEGVLPKHKLAVTTQSEPNQNLADCCQPKKGLCISICIGVIQTSMLYIYRSGLYDTNRSIHPHLWGIFRQGLNWLMLNSESVHISVRIQPSSIYKCNDREIKMAAYAICTVL